LGEETVAPRENKHPATLLGMLGSILSLLHSGEEKKKKHVLDCNNLEDPAKNSSHLSYDKISG
jgi:hypothetical protein